MFSFHCCAFPAIFDKVLRIFDLGVSYFFSFCSKKRFISIMNDFAFFLSPSNAFGILPLSPLLEDESSAISTSDGEDGGVGDLSGGGGVGDLIGGSNGSSSIGDPFGDWGGVRGGVGSLGGFVSLCGVINKGLSSSWGTPAKLRSLASA
jgi:hypothetical protein